MIVKSKDIKNRAFKIDSSTTKNSYLGTNLVTALASLKMDDFTHLDVLCLV